MTICIAAIGRENDHEVIVIATDHMVTMGDLGQFEHTITKYKVINDDSVAMIAGNPLLFNDLIKVPDPNVPYAEIKNQIQQNFKSKRKEVLQNQILDVFGLDYDYVSQAVKTTFPNPAIEETIRRVAQFKLDTSILLAGYSGDSAMISEISEKMFADYRDLNFHAIGSGTIQAINTLLFQKHGKEDSLLTTVYDVYKAKRNAEAAKGVGKDTKMVILLKGKGCRVLAPQHTSSLQEIYEQELKFGRNHIKLEELKGISEEGSLCS